MVGADTHGDVDLLLFILTLAILTGRSSETILLARDSLDFLDDWLEDICIIVRVLVLQHANQALEAHTGIDDVHREWFERTVSLAVVLHEHDVPDLDHLWVVLVYQLTAWHLSLLLRSTRVNMDLRARTARTRIAHLPEVVVLVAVDDVVGRYVLCPVTCSLVVALQTFLLAALEHGNVEVLWVELQYFSKVFPCHIDGTLLEVVAEAPVTEHLEHGVVISIMTYLFEVVVLTANTETFLSINTTYILTWVLCTEDDVFPLVHTSICKHQRRVILDNHRC